ncbi:Glutathione S-transferase [Shimia sp. SK013]|uniref:glutathione S-transferase family protein n=1 Tax=Shimia sp. SK013 TaxID=1389006 RepID=UPI0006B5E9ED|nr:glutathione S-transferase family protein [Shimia sp. SK013]KPA21350.1 Glutathione S-transferase [Shimia sp. SK013]
MTKPLRLHYAPDNASLIVRLALEELGVPYETVLVDRRTAAHYSPPFRAINLAGKIPALETPDGPIFETAAILLWLADAYKGLAPVPDTRERAAFVSWLFYLSNTMHANLRMTFYPDQYIAEIHRAALVVGVRKNLNTALALLDDLAGAGHTWINATTPSALDLYLGAMLRWMALYPKGDTAWFTLSDWPSLTILASKLDVRPSTAALRTAEGMAANPFTAPKPPTPPEGSAL